MSEHNVLPRAVEYALSEAKLLLAMLGSLRAITNDCRAAIDAAAVPDAPSCHPDDHLAEMLSALTGWIAVAEVSR